MSDSTVSLGTVSASAGLDLRPLQAAVKDAAKLLRSLGESLKGVEDLKFSGPVLSQLEGIGDTARIVTADVRELRLSLKALGQDLGLKPVAEQITRIGVNAVQASGGLDDLATGLKLVKGEGQGVSSAFVGVKDTLKEVRDAAASGASAFGKLGQRIEATGTAGPAASAGIGDAGKAAEDAGLAADGASAGFATLKTELSGVATAGNRAALALGRAGAASKAAGAASVSGAAAGMGGAGQVPFRRPAGRGSVMAGMGLAGLRGLGGMAANAAGGVTIIAGLSTKNAVDFGGKAQQIAGNTTMSAADQKGMYAGGLRAMRMGGDGEGAMRSYMHIANHKYGGAEADRINDMAVKMNVATGANTELSGQVVSSLMHQMGLKGTAKNVSRIGNMIHQTTASGDLDLENYNKYAAPAVAKGLALGNSPADTAAFITALTQNGVRAPQAATNANGITWQITHPTAKAQKAIDKAGLSEYFGAGKLEKYGLHEIITKTFDAVGHNQNKLMDVFGNKQGGFGAIIASKGKGARDYANQLYDPKTGNLAALQGKLNPVEQRYDQMAKTPAQQAKVLAGTLKADSIEVGNDFIPVLTKLLPVLKTVAEDLLKVTDRVAKLPMPVQEAILGLGAFKIATFALGNPLVGLGEGVGTLVTKLMGLEGGAAVLGGLGAAAGPIALVAAAVVAFGIAWKTNFGGIRQAFAPFLADVKQTFGGSGKAITDFVKTTLPDLKKFVHEVEPLFAEGFKEMAGSVKVAFDIIKFVVKSALAVIGGIFRTVLALLTGDWKGAWAGINSIFDGEMKALLGLANDLAPKFVQWISKLGADMGKGASELGEDIKRGFFASIAGLKAGFSEAGRDLASSFGSGLRNGLASAGSGIASAAHAAANLIPIHSRLALDSHSPSRVMHKIGQDAGQGLANGILSKKDEVARAARDVSDAATTSSKGHTRRTHEQVEADKAARHAKSLAAQRERKVQSATNYAETVGLSPEQKDLRKLSQDHAAGLTSEKTYSDGLVRVWHQYHETAEKAYAGHLKRLQTLRQQFQGFMSGVSAMTAAGKARTAKDTHAPDDLADARDARIGAAGDVYTKQVDDIEGFKKSGQFAPGDIKAATAATKDAYMTEYRAAWDDYNAAVKKQGDQSVRDVNALQTEIARATAHANAHTWKDGEAQAREYFQSLRDEALDSFNQVEAKIDATPNITDDQKAGLHTGSRGAYNASLGDIDTQESDAAAKRKLDALKAQRDQAQEAYGAAGGKGKQGYADALGGILGQIPANAGPEAETMRHEVQTELNRLSQDGKGTVSELGKSVIESLGSAFDQAMSHAKKAGSVWKEIMQSMKLDAKSIFLSFLSKEFKDGLLSLFTHKEKGVAPQGVATQGALTGAPVGGPLSFGGLVPSVQFGGGSQAHGLNGLLGAMPLLSGLSQIHGINGPIGGQMGKSGGGLMDIAGLAASFLPGGSLLGKLFGGGGGLFGGLKKLHLFKNGGIVPGKGFHDSVPALLTPGEVVSNHDQQKAQGDNHFHFNHYGDVHGIDDMKRVQEDGAFMLAQQLTTATAGN